MSLADIIERIKRGPVGTAPPPPVAVPTPSPPKIAPKPTPKPTPKKTDKPTSKPSIPPKITPSPKPVSHPPPPKVIPKMSLPLPLGIKPTSKLGQVLTKTTPSVPTESKPTPDYHGVVSSPSGIPSQTGSSQLDYLLLYAEPEQARRLSGVIASRKPDLLRNIEFQTASQEAYQSLTTSEKISYAEKFYKFGEDEKTWAEVKGQGWELQVDKEGNIKVVTPLTSEKQLLKWHREKYKDVDPVTGYVSKLSSSLWHGTFNPEFWTRLFTGGPEHARVVVARREYEIDPVIASGDWGVQEHVWSIVSSPGYTNIIIPFTIGAGFGATFRGIGLAAKSATGITAKVLTQFTRKTPYVFGATISGMVGADVGYTAAIEEKGLVPSGTTFTKVSRYGMQFGFVGLGAKWFSTRQPFFKKELLVRYSDTGEPLAVGQRKFIDILGKPRYYGKPQVVVKPDSLFVKTFDPQLGYAQVSRYGVSGSTPTVVGKPPGLGTALAVRPTGALVPKFFSDIMSYNIISPIRGRIDYGLKPLDTIKFESSISKMTIDKEYNFEKYYDNLEKLVADKLGVSFKTPKPKMQTLRVDEFGEGYAKVFKYGVKGVTPTVVGKPPSIPTGALVVRQPFQLVTTKFPLRSILFPSQAKPLFRMQLEPKTYMELERGRELERLWDEKLQRQYEENLDLVARKFSVQFKQPKPIVKTLRVDEFGEGYAKVFKYGVKGVTPTVVGKPPKPGFGIYTGRQPILRPISDLTVWDWLARQAIRPSVVKQPLFKIFTIKMKPLKFTLKDIVKEPKIEPTDTITRDGQILIQKTVKTTKPPFFKKKLVRPESIFDAYDTYGDYEFVRNEVVESFGKLTGKPSMRVSMPKSILSVFPILKHMPTVKTAMDSDILMMHSQFPVSKMDQGVMLDVGKVYDTGQMQTQVDIQKFDYGMDIVSIDKTLPISGSAVDVASIQDLIQEQLTIQERPTKLMGKLPTDSYELFGHTFGQGYNVKVRERHYVKGKKVKEGKFIRINKRPLNLKNAESLMGMVLDNSAAASGKIIPVNAMAQEPLIDLKPFENIEHKFYMKDNIHIEKPRYRIDTKGEVKGISALGWYAEKTKKAAKKKTVVSRPRARRQPVDMFDMGMDNMLINMDKIFKGVFNGF